MVASKIIIIPDLHGREFWRGAVKDLSEETHVVFLGDYMDPYEDDWIYWSDAFKSLQDIIAFKKAHPDQVTLLFGNHDLHYLFPQLKGSRYNEYQEGRLRDVFSDNLDAFQMAAEYTLGGIRYLFPMPASIPTGRESIPVCSAPLRRSRPKHSTGSCSCRNSWTRLQK